MNNNNLKNEKPKKQKKKKKSKVNYKNKNKNATGKNGKKKENKDIKNMEDLSINEIILRAIELSKDHNGSRVVQKKYDEFSEEGAVKFVEGWIC